MMLGFALAAVGIDIVTGQLRLTFGLTELLSGFDFLVAVIGLFGIGEILLSHGGRAGVHRAQREDQPEDRAGNLEEAAALLGDLDPQLHHRLLDGHHPGRRDAGLVHELRRGAQACPRTATSSAPASSRAWWRRKPRRMPPAPPRCCR